MSTFGLNRKVFKTKGLRAMNEALNALITRKSARSFQKRHVEKALVEEIIAAGLNAPTGMNRQTPLFVAVSDDSTVAQLSKMNAAIMGAAKDPFYGAQDVIIVLAKREGTYLYDGSLAMGNLLNAAWALGLGACWIHRAKEVFMSEEGKQLLKKWGVTDDVEGIGFCILGYTDAEKPKTEIKDGRVFYI